STLCHVCACVSCLLLLAPPTSPRFPYTTLFRSRLAARIVQHLDGAAVQTGRPAGDRQSQAGPARGIGRSAALEPFEDPGPFLSRSEEHTSELQSRFDLVCRLLLEKKKT